MVNGPIKHMFLALDLLAKLAESWHSVRNDVHSYDLCLAAHDLEEDHRRDPREDRRARPARSAVHLSPNACQTFRKFRQTARKFRECSIKISAKVTSPM